ncbi:MAG: hypothetical protein HOP30_08735 [Cyclobacteriaceae bacterium]|nr:hypothetical protein [Cyclobacteriaceae bacterium]
MNETSEWRPPGYPLLLLVVRSAPLRGNRYYPSPADARVADARNVLDPLIVRNFIAI